MRYFLYSILLVIFINTNVLGQITFVPGQTKFSAGIFFTPEAIFLGKLPVDVKLGNRVSCAYGFNLRYSINKQWSITSGVQGSNKVFMAFVTVKDKHNNYVGSFKKKSSYAFVEMPLLVSYEKEYNKIVSIYTTAGATLGYLSHEKVADPGAHTPDVLFDGKNAYIYQSKAYVYDRTDLANFGYHEYLVNSFLGVGALLKIDKNVSFLIQPNFKYALSNMHKKEPSKFPLQYTGRPYSFGVMMGCFIRI